MIQSVSIDGKDMYETYGVILASKSIGQPSLKTKYVDVPLKDGSIDLTETLAGSAKYSDRDLTITFLYLGNGKTAVESAIANDLFGKKVKIVFDDDMSFYYLGRVVVDSISAKDLADKIVLKATCEPFKHDLFASDESWEWDSFDFEGGIINETASIEVNGSASYTLICRRGGACPTFTVSESMNLNYNGTYYYLRKGTDKLYELSLAAGENLLKFEGNGTVSINYVGGSL